MHLPEIQKKRGLLRRPLPLNPNTAATRFAHRRLSDEKNSWERARRSKKFTFRYKNSKAHFAKHTLFFTFYKFILPVLNLFFWKKVCPKIKNC